MNCLNVRAYRGEANNLNSELPTIEYRTIPYQCSPIPRARSYRPTYTTRRNVDSDNRRKFDDTDKVQHLNERSSAILDIHIHRRAAKSNDPVLKENEI